ncbi:MAG TPA: hypothetical protein VHO01_15255 [Jatrophihabitans sp.]|nr:hypothetical protein [Jatrophihabitans sp.]
MALSSALTAGLVGLVAQRLAHDRMAPWVLGRAGGVLAYLLLVALVSSGLLLSHPARFRYRIGPAQRIRLHALLAALTASFTVLHVIALSIDRYAGVGWWGALVPAGSSYRPVPVSLGVLGLWSGAAAGLTAAGAGRLPRRIWWPLHKLAAVSLVLCWLHATLAGSDASALRWYYIGSALPVIALAMSRYAAAGPAERVRGRLS